MTQNDWIVVSYKIARKPSKYRVNIWRRLRQCGAINKGRSLWTLPYSHSNYIAANHIKFIVERYGGTAFVVKSEFDPVTASKMTADHVESRIQDYKNLIKRCIILLNEIHESFITRKFNYHLLSSFERKSETLIKRFKNIAEIDFFSVPLQASAEEFVLRLIASVDLIESEMAPRCKYPDY